MAHQIIVKLADEELEGLCSGGPDNGPKLARLIINDVNDFEQWMRENLGGGLSKIERAAIQTYLYSKIVGRLDSLPQKKIDPIESIG